jgi:hypothetical protein
MRATAIRRAAAWTSSIIMASFGFTSVVSAQTITNTGPNSTNTITTNTTNTCTVQNTNNISVHNSNTQVGVSGDATSSGNTGLSWSGWDALSPEAAQANAQSFTAWDQAVTNWISQRASSSWSGAGDNTSWSPSSSGWNSWDPMSWQANGQSFANWYSGVEAYLDSNGSTWLLSWPADATGNGGSGASTGNVTNTNNANFTITINNASRAAAGTNACGQSNFTPPPVGGMGGGPVNTYTPSAPVAHIISQPQYNGGNGSGGGSYVQPHGSSSIATSTPQQTSAPVYTAPAQSQPTTPCPPAGGSGGSGTGSSISNTGQNSTNTITSATTNTTSVTNTNNINVSNVNYQYGSSGDSSSSGNTGSGGAWSGSTANDNGTGIGAAITN